MKQTKPNETYTDDLESEEFSQTYINRRVISSDEPHEILITQVGHLENGNFGIVFSSGKDTFLLEFNTPNISGDYTESNLVGFLNETSTESLSKLKGKSIDVYFTSDMSAIGFKQGECDFSITQTKNTSLINSNEPIQSVEQDVSLLQDYLHSDPTKCSNGGWKHIISDVSGMGSESFLVEITTNVGETIRWTFDVPKSTDPNTNTTARLIEEVGYGDPKNLINEEILVLHKSDVDEHIEHVGVDESNTWFLVTPDQFEEWGVRKSEEQRRKKYERTSHSRRKRKKYTAFSIYFVFLHFFFTRYVVPNLGPNSHMEPVIHTGLTFSLCMSILLCIYYTVNIHLCSK